MEQFSLAEYLKNPTRPIVTRDGRSVRIVCTDKADRDFPVIALITTNQKSEEVFLYTKNGKQRFNSESDLPFDLFFAPEKKEGWINLYKDGNKTVIGNVCPLESEELAKEAMSDKDYIATCKIEWEE